VKTTRVRKKLATVRMSRSPAANYTKFLVLFEKAVNEGGRAFSITVTNDGMWLEMGPARDSLKTKKTTAKKRRH